jgi:hypothetical protein
VCSTCSWHPWETPPGRWENEVVSGHPSPDEVCTKYIYIFSLSLSLIDDDDDGVCVYRHDIFFIDA